MNLNEKIDQLLNEPNKTIEQIAKKTFGVDTLKTRNSDDKDFYDISIWTIKKGLEEAYKAGQQGK